VIWPFAVAALVFWFVAFKGRRSGNLGSMRQLIDQYAMLCRRIAAERIRLPALQGPDHAAALGRLDSLEKARVKLEQRAVRLRESLVKGGFAIDGAQLTTVEDAETELRAELAQRNAGAV